MQLRTIVVTALTLSALTLPAAGQSGRDPDEVEAARQRLLSKREARKRHLAERLAACNHAWPPKLGEPYPDMLLFDPQGKEVRLSTLKGKTLLIHLAAMSSPGSVGYTGGKDAEPFAGCSPQRNVPTLEAWLKRNHVDVEHPELRIVHVLLYGKSHTDPPAAADLREWIQHFQLDQRPNTLVLRGDVAYVNQDTYPLIPGIQLVGPDFRLRVDCGRNSGKSWQLVTRELRKLQRNVIPPDPEPLPEPHAELRLRLQRALLAKDYAALEAALKEQAKRGRREGTLDTWFGLADHRVYSKPWGELIPAGPLDAWVEARPESWLASYVRGLYRIRVGWNARGSGLANTVTERGWQVFAEQLRLAHGDLERALQLEPKQPYAATALLTVARARNLPLAHMQAYLGAALEADPGHLPAYQMALEYLKPKWHGSNEAAFGFAANAKALRPEDPAMDALALDLQDEVMRAARDKRTYLRQPAVQQLLASTRARLLTHFPRDVWLRETYFKLSVLAEQPDLELGESLAKEGNAYACFTLGVMYRDGEGVPLDHGRGIRLLLRSGVQGSGSAAAKVAHALLYHKAYRHDPARAIAWLKRAAAGGSAWSQATLGKLYYEGEHVEQDLEAALAALRPSAGRFRWARLTLIELLEKHPKLRQPGDPR